MSLPNETKRPAEKARSAGGRPSPQDEIRARAYELYQERGGQGNHAIDDWLRAEAEVNQNRGNRKAA